MSKSKGGKKRTKSDHIYSKTLPKAAMGVRIELGQQGAMGGASLMGLRSAWGDACGEMAD